jgi:hypothetical protein
MRLLWRPRGRGLVALAIVDPPLVPMINGGNGTRKLLHCMQLYQ